jgi:hypothetical protein
VQDAKKLQLWCLIAKGYTDIEIDYRAAKRDWLVAQDIAKELGENQWATRASGEFGLLVSDSARVGCAKTPSRNGVYDRNPAITPIPKGSNNASPEFMRLAPL